MKINTLKTLHNAVIHISKTKAKESDIELEDKWIKKYPNSALKNVCSDCFERKSVEDMI